MSKDTNSINSRRSDLNKVSINEKALALIESFEKGDLINPDTEIIEGVEQLTIPVIKFEKDGQTLIGLYTGNRECPSTMSGPSDYFYFHTLLTSRNIEVGFCGSKALDDALLKKEPFRYIIFIKFLSQKKVKSGNFKRFQIMAIDMQNENNPLYKIKNNPFVKLYNNIFSFKNQKKNPESEDNVKY